MTPAPQSVKTARLRLIIIGAFYALFCLIIVARLVDVSLLSQFRHNAKKAAIKTDSGDTENLRAEIRDRNGVLLATTLRMASVYADPKGLLDINDAAAKIAAVLGDDAAGLQQKLSKPRARFVWIKRNITPKQEYEINKLGLPGVDFRYEEKRIYPLDNLTSHVVGYTDKDDNGIAGIEKKFDERLKTDNTPLVLSLDARVQHIVRREVAKAVERFTAIGGTGVVMDVTTGEIIAMVSQPDFDPHDPTKIIATEREHDPRFNRATLGMYEMGSTFKTLTTALVLDSGAVKIHDVFNVAAPIHIGGFTIHDFHPINHPVEVSEIFKESSNIGTVHMVEKVGTQLHHAFIEKLGLTKPVELELPEIGQPLVPHPWKDISTITIAFGHGISVSPVHLVRALGAVVNGGYLIKPTLMKQADYHAELPPRLISEETSHMIRRLLRLVVTEGTGKSAEANGYVVGGKTGTSEKLGAGGRYLEHSLISSFIAAFPVNKPRYVVLVMVDEPHPRKDTYGFATGGWVAAPAVAQIVNGIAPILGVAPQDENDPQLKDDLTIH